MVDHNHEQTLQRIREQLKEMGDMPIFSASVNRVHVVGSDPDADAMALSMEILKDANLTTKVLKLANSPIFNRGMGKIGNLSRAVVVLGFDTVKSAVLTLKLIDSFQQQNPSVDMTSLLVNAYLSASFVRGLSARCGVKDIEQTYICGLLHNLGDIVVAYTLPEEYGQIKQLQQEEGLSRREAERRVLGTELSTLGQDIVSDWEFPQSVVKTIGAKAGDSDTPIRNQTELTASLAALASETMDLLYSERPASNKTLAELNYQLSKTAGIKKEHISEALEHSFKQCCEMAQTYSLSSKHLAPRVRNSGDSDLDKLASQFSYYARQELPTDASAKAPNPAKARNDSATAAKAKAAPQAGGDANLLLGILFEITTLMSQKSSINTILAKVLEGMQLGIGFDRTALCLLTPDHKQYSARLAMGQDADALKNYFNLTVNTQRDLFSKVIMEGSELRVDDIDHGGWRQQLPGDFAASVGAQGFLIASLRGKNRPIGMFYADRAISGTPITAEDQHSFSQLVAQARLALQMR